MKIKAKIIYKIDGNHPDIQDLPEKYPAIRSSVLADAFPSRAFVSKSQQRMSPDALEIRYFPSEESAISYIVDL